MHFTSSFALVASFLSLSDAIRLVERRSARPAVVGLDTTRKRSLLSAPQRDRLRKRGTLQETLDNESTLYFANVTLGTPGQSLRLDIDTGSSDLWTNSASSDLCQQYSQECDQSGTYNANSSSSYTYLNSEFQIKYADGSYAIGDYGTDTLHIGGQDITSMQFGIGYNSTSAQGILGIGYTTNEATIATTGKTYNNLPQLLVNQKKTNTAAYSLWLNDLDANVGSILFGGVDSDKYHGDLSTVPIIKESGTYKEFIVGLSSVTAAGQTVFNSAIPVLLDSGSSLTYLPDNYAEAIFKIFRATYDSNAGAAVVDCSYMNSDSTVDFSFSGVNISVPMNELVILDGYSRGKAVCILGISAAGSQTSVLGDTFLRSAYVVYDLTNNEISLAPTNFNATSSNIQEIATGSDGVPNATPVANAVSTLAVSTGGARNGGQPDVTQIAWAAPTKMPSMGGLAAAAAAAGLAFAL